MTAIGWKYYGITFSVIVGLDPTIHDYSKHSF
jgi:hypothetical protein